MKHHELAQQLDREAPAGGYLEAPVKALSESGFVYDVIQVESEQQPDGSYITWLKLGEDDG
jgi:hypothetical protein